MQRFRVCQGAYQGWFAEDSCRPHILLDIIVSYYYIITMDTKAKKKGVKIVPLPVYLPEDVHKALRHAAIDEGRSATDIIRELVKEYLAKQKRRKGVK